MIKTVRTIGIAAWHSLHEHAEVWIVAIAVAAHLWGACAFGAAFWVDSSVYIQYGESFKSLEAFRYTFGEIWNPVRDSHVVPGMPLIWLCLSSLPAAWRWPVLAVAQHGLGALAVSVLFCGAVRRHRSRWLVLGTAILCFNPFYQSFHNMLMTEAVTVSILLLSLNLLLGVRGRAWIGMKVASWSGVLVFLICQFRACAGLMVAGWVGLAWLRTSRRRLVYLVPVALGLVAGYYGFALVRFAATGDFVRPGLRADRFVYVLAAAPCPSVRARHTAEAELPDGWTLERFEGKNGAIHELGHCVAAMRAEGSDDRQIVKRFGRAASALASDGRFLLHRLVYACAGSGLTLVFRLGPLDYEIKRGSDMRGALYGALGHYRWLAWIYYASYREDFDFLVKRPARLYPDAGQWRLLAAMVELYLVDAPVWCRDPFWLGRVFPDVWAVSGLVAGLYLLLKRRVEGLMILWAFALNGAVLASVPLSGVRYCYILLPIALAGVSTALSVRCGGSVGRVVDQDDGSSRQIAHGP